MDTNGKYDCVYSWLQREKFLMNIKEHELLYKEEVFKIVGCAMEVLNTLGNGLLEKPYENAMIVEFNLNNIAYVQQKNFPIIYKDVNIGNYIPDLIAFDKIIVEIKTIESISNSERAQMINYLKITGLRVGVILNFKKAKLEWERIVV